METWIILNSRDMLIREYDDRDEALKECERLNADPDKYSVYRVMRGPDRKS